MLIWLDNFFTEMFDFNLELILTTKIKNYNDLKDQSLLSVFSDVYDTVWEAKTIIFQCIQCASLSHIEDAVVIKSPKIISIFWTY